MVATVIVVDCCWGCDEDDDDDDEDTCDWDCDVDDDCLLFMFDVDAGDGKKLEVFCGGEKL